MAYPELLVDLKKVDFDTDNALDHLSSGDSKAIKAMFAYPEQQAHNGVEDGFEGNRQSNGAGGKSLFAASQGKNNPFRHARLQAYNGSFVPVVSLQALCSHVCSTLDQLITDITANTFKRTDKWPAELKELWRHEPHGNWHGDLPEARITEGERNWEKENRDRHGYKMNEWQVIRNGRMQYPFSKVLADDPGAIRIVSVASTHRMRAQNWSFVPPEGEAGPDKYHRVAEGDKLKGMKFKSKSVEPYTGSVVNRNVEGRPDRVSFGLPWNAEQSKQTDHTRRLYNRAAIRFYFSFNHYRTINVQTSHGSFVLNPWFAIMRD